MNHHNFNLKNDVLFPMYDFFIKCNLNLKDYTGALPKIPKYIF